MSPHFIDDQTFKHHDFTQIALQKGTYENCQFQDCNLSTVRLTGFIFIDCQFSNCDFSNAILTETGLQNILFDRCKLIGIRFDSFQSFLFSANFNHCRLDFSSFYQVDLRKSIFQACSLVEVDFANANLSKIVLKKCNLSNAIFEQTNLSETDFRTAINFNIEPSVNQINKAKFSVNGLIGLLRKYNLSIEI